MAKDETQSPTVEQLPAAEKEANPAEPDEKKLEKPKASKEKKPRKPKTAAAHPPYFQMIKEALLALNEKSGSSPYAIAKYIEETHKSVLPLNFRKTLSLQLKNYAAKGELVKIRASYKLSETRKMARSTMTTRQKKIKQQETKTRKTTRSSSNKKTMSVNKPEVATKKKRSGAKKTKPRQPKTIKSPASRKAMKASAS